MDGAAVVRRANVRDPWEVVAATPGFTAAAIDDAPMRATIDDEHTLVLTGHLMSAEDSRLVSAFAARAQVLLSRR